MKTWIVYIVPYAGVRYIDTQWASEQAAIDRKGDVINYWKAAGNLEAAGCGHRIYIVAGKIEDAAIQEQGL